MGVVPVAEQMTAEEFLARPETNSARRESLVDGELVVNQPLPSHAQVQVNLVYALESWIRSGPARGRVATPLDVRLDDHNVFNPDLLWYAEGRAPTDQSPAPYPLPSIAAEIRSPSTWRYDLGTKKSSYERHGLAELWLLDTVAHTALVYRRSRHGAPSFDLALELSGAEPLTSPLLSGFSVTADEILMVPGA